MTETIILASTSPYRRLLLQRLRLPFTAVRPEFEEAVDQARGLEPAALATTLARGKARAVAAHHSGAIVIGSDQVCALGDTVFGKPGHRAGAVAQLRRLRGRLHRLHTAVCVVHGANEIAFTDHSELHMRDLNDGEIERYVDADQPFDCAGAYKLEGAGIALFARVNSADHTAIIGLPLVQLCAVLRDLGVKLP